MDDTVGYWFYTAGYWRVIGGAGVTYTAAFSVNAIPITAVPISITLLPDGDYFTIGLDGSLTLINAAEAASIFNPIIASGSLPFSGPISIFGQSWYGFNSGIAEKHDAVAVEKVQYQTIDTSVFPFGTKWVDTPPILYVLVGTTVTFKALPLAPDTVFPPDKPVWSGTAGASGTGAIKMVAFGTTSTSAADIKTVTVKCGNTITLNVIVYNIIPNPIPVDNFANRDLGTYGVGEDVTLATMYCHQASQFLIRLYGFRHRERIRLSRMALYTSVMSTRQVTSR